MIRAEKEQICIRYTVFRTKWGYFGLAGTAISLLRTHLPAHCPEIVERRLVEALLLDMGRIARPSKSFLKPLQEQVIAYFEGSPIDFSAALPLAIDGFRPFTRSVLNACRSIKFGQMVSYKELAGQLGRPNACRAVGNALAANPMPLIIPCHRVIRDDSSLGGFSAPGGTALKRRLLLHEQDCQQMPRQHN